MSDRSNRICRGLCHVLTPRIVIHKHDVVKGSKLEAEGCSVANCWSYGKLQLNYIHLDDNSVLGS